MRRPFLLLAACLPILCAMPSSASAIMRESLPAEIRRELPARLQNVSARTRRTIAAKQMRRSAAKSRVLLRQARSSSSSAARVRERAEQLLDKAQEIQEQSSSSSSPRVIAPRPAATPSSDVQGQVLALVNEARADSGLPALAYSAELEHSAQNYAERMNKEGFFSHKDPDGNSSLERIRATGYLTAPCDCGWDYATGENIAKGQRSAAQAMADWMQSAGHRENILNPGFTEIGVGVSGNLWVQHFGTVTPR